MAKKRSGPIVGVDLGTENVRAVAVDRNDIDGLDIMGYACVPSTGLRRGQVVNIGGTSDDLKKVMAELQLMMGDKRPHDFYCSISGNHIEGQNSTGDVTVRAEVHADDVDRVLRQARTTSLQPGREILHVLPTYYTIDKAPPVQTPVGHAGVRLHADVHLVTASRAVIDNTYTCGARADLRVQGLAFSALAASDALLTDPEKEMGVLLVDIGAGTTDIIIWHDRSVRYVGSVPLGGWLMSNDVAVGLSTTRAEAEKIKVRWGYAYANGVDPAELIEVPGIGARAPATYTRQHLASLIEPHVTEIFTKVVDAVKGAGLESLIRSTGVVLTGGVAQLPGMADFARELLGLNVRIADMQLSIDDKMNWGGMTNIFQDPQYAVALGIVSMANRGELDMEMGTPSVSQVRTPGSSGGVFDWFKRVFK